MKQLVSLSVFTLISIIFLQYQKGALAEEEKSCNTLVQELTKKQLNGITGCTKSMKFKNGKDKAKKMTCVMKCVMKKELFLDENGQASFSQFEQFLDKHFPPSFHEKINGTFRPCIDGAAKGMDDSDEFCKDYDPMIKCLMGALPNMCK